MLISHETHPPSKTAGIHETGVYQGTFTQCEPRLCGSWLTPSQEIGWTHMRILEGVGTLVQLGGLIARLCKLVRSTVSVRMSFVNHPLQNMKPQLFQL